MHLEHTQFLLILAVFELYLRKLKKSSRVTCLGTTTNVSISDPDHRLQPIGSKSKYLSPASWAIESDMFLLLILCTQILELIVEIMSTLQLFLVACSLSNEPLFFNSCMSASLRIFSFGVGPFVDIGSVTPYVFVFILTIRIIKKKNQ